MYYKLSAIALILVACTNVAGCGEKTPANGGPKNGKITLTTDKLEFTVDGDAKTVGVTSDKNWTAGKDADWIGVFEAEKEIIVTVGKNDKVESRSGSITITTDDDSKTVTVSQAGINAALAVDPGALNFEAGADTKTVTVTSVLEWTASESEDWIWLLQADDGFTVTVTVNEDLQSRGGEITVSNGVDAETKTIVVEQAGRAPVRVTSIELNESVVMLQPNGTATLTATVNPDNADNKAVTWNNMTPAAATITTDGLTCTVTAAAVGETTITVIADDGSNIKAECKVIVQSSQVLPPADARTSGLWAAGSQTWSDVINVPACNKTDFAGGSASDCRNNDKFSDTRGYFYSFQYVTANGATMCPAPWSIPTMDDFVALDRALGGTGSSQTNTALRDKYFDDWGAQISGYASSFGIYNLTEASGEASYWTSEEGGSGAYMLKVSGNGDVDPKASERGTYGTLYFKIVMEHEKHTIIWLETGRNSCLPVRTRRLRR